MADCWLLRLWLTAVFVAVAVFAEDTPPTVPTQILSQRFDGQEGAGIGKGTTQPPPANEWTVIADTTLGSAGYLKVVDEASSSFTAGQEGGQTQPDEGNSSSNVFFEAWSMGTSGSWRSRRVNISCYKAVSASLSYQAVGALNPLDWMTVIYIINDSQTGRSFDIRGGQSFPNTFTRIPVASNISASTLQVMVLMSTGQSPAGFRIDDVEIVGQPADYFGWSDWRVSEWSLWSLWTPAQCGYDQRSTRSRLRERTCLPEGCGAADCPGDAVVIEFQNRTRSAEENCCAVDGVWSKWLFSHRSEWTEWAPAQCGVQQRRNQTVSFERTCTGPQCGGKPCVGPSTFETTSVETRDADENCCAVDGGWSSWTNPSWSTWSPFVPEECGQSQERVRTRFRQRFCDSPQPACGGQSCPGNSTRFDIDIETRSAEENCCRVDGQWTDWLLGPWSEWGSFQPQTCGRLQTRQRTRTKSRNCIDPAPSCGGTACTGSDAATDTETQTRSAQENCCAVDAEWSDWAYSAWTAWSSFSPDRCGVNQARSRTRDRTRNCDTSKQACGGTSICEGRDEEVVTEREARTAEENCCRIDGDWSVWRASEWTAWTPFHPAHCGVEQHRQRSRNVTRNCDSPEPSCGGAACNGSDFKNETEMETRSSIDNCCVVNGNWSEWTWTGPWSDWTPFHPPQCGQLQTRQRYRARERSCNSPAPQCGGMSCEGEATEVVEDVDTQYIPPVDGGWSNVTFMEWSDWSPVDERANCSADLIARRYRRAVRSCTEPEPACGGAPCEGNSTWVEMDSKTLPGLEPVDGGWSPWQLTEWTSWSRFEPQGCDVEQTRNRTRTRFRRCNSPAPVCDGAPCAGPSSEVIAEYQNRTAARRDGQWSEWLYSPWSTWSAWSPPGCGLVQQRQRWRNGTRQCDSPSPLCGGSDCMGNATRSFVEHATRSELESCEAGCQQAGGWSSWHAGVWTNWTALNTSLCGVPQQRTRARTLMRECNNPAPVCGGAPCLGDAIKTDEETSIVTLSFMVGAWTNWTVLQDWSPWYDAPSPQGNGSVTQQHLLNSQCLSPGSKLRQRHRILHRRCAPTTHLIQPSNTTCDTVVCEEDAFGSITTRTETLQANLTVVVGNDSSLTAFTYSGHSSNQTTWQPVPLPEASLCCSLNATWVLASASEWSAWQNVEQLDNISMCETHVVRRRSRMLNHTCVSPTPWCPICGDSPESTETQETTTVESLAVDGGWSTWQTQSWSSWTGWMPLGCGIPQQRHRTRNLTRTCTEPAPFCGGSTCAGNDTLLETQAEHRTANATCDDACIIDGQWSAWTYGEWSDWTSFQPTKCGFDQTRRRTRGMVRQCDSPAPRCGGAPCQGQPADLDIQEETRNASINCCRVDGGWTSWSDTVGPWSSWEPFACGVSQARSRTVTRTRTCTAPSPSCGGNPCLGIASVEAVELDNRTEGFNCCPGTYQPANNPDTCVPTKTCGLGQYIKVPATSTSDAECGDCQLGQLGDGRMCRTCGPGHFVPEAPESARCEDFRCKPGTTDHDQNAATPCVPCAGQCPAGTKESRSCSATADRQCSACPADTYSPDGLACRTCAPPCANGTYAVTRCDGATNNVCRRCTPESECAFGVRTSCTAMADTVCAASPTSPGGDDDDASGKGDPDQSSGSEDIADSPWFWVALVALILCCMTNAFWIGWCCSSRSRSRGKAKSYNVSESSGQAHELKRTRSDLQETRLGHVYQDGNGGAAYNVPPWAEQYSEPMTSQSSHMSLQSNGRRIVLPTGIPMFMSGGGTAGGAASGRGPAATARYPPSRGSSVGVANEIYLDGDEAPSFGVEVINPTLRHPDYLYGLSVSHPYSAGTLIEPAGEADEKPPVPPRYTKPSWTTKSGRNPRGDTMRRSRSDEPGATAADLRRAVLQNESRLDSPQTSSASDEGQLDMRPTKAMLKLIEKTSKGSLQLKGSQDSNIGSNESETDATSLGMSQSPLVVRNEPRYARIKSETDDENDPPYERLPSVESSRATSHLYEDLNFSSHGDGGDDDDEGDSAGYLNVGQDSETDSHHYVMLPPHPGDGDDVSIDPKTSVAVATSPRKSAGTAAGSSRDRHGPHPSGPSAASASLYGFLPNRPAAADGSAGVNGPPATSSYARTVLDGDKVRVVDADSDIPAGVPADTEVLSDGFYSIFANHNALAKDEDTPDGMTEQARTVFNNLKGGKTAASSDAAPTSPVAAGRAGAPTSPARQDTIRDPDEFWAKDFIMKQLMQHAAGAGAGGAKGRGSAGAKL